jgi:hypothetical protein
VLGVAAAAVIAEGASHKTLAAPYGSAMCESGFISGTITSAWVESNGAPPCLGPGSSQA